jgi:hypothetical protein
MMSLFMEYPFSNIGESKRDECHELEVRIQESEWPKAFLPTVTDPLSSKHVLTTTIGVGTKSELRPSLRTEQADFPHSALRCGG